MPNTLPYDGTPLYLQVRDYLATDTDPTLGLVSALGDGVNSLYPQWEDDGIDIDPQNAPRPFLILQDGGIQVEGNASEDRRLFLFAVEVHVPQESGVAVWPGLVKRLKFWLFRQNWRPTSDDLGAYRGGPQLRHESATLPDGRYNTLSRQLVFGVTGLDQTSFRGRQG